MAQPYRTAASHGGREPRFNKEELLPRGNFEGTQEVNDYIDNLDQAVAKYELNQDISVICGTSKEALQKMGVNLHELVGSTIRESGYTSSSLSENVAKEFARSSGDTPVLLQIDIPKGKGRGAYIEYFSKNAGEQEFIIKRDATFYIYEENNKDGFIILKARLLS